MRNCEIDNRKKYCISEVKEKIQKIITQNISCVEYKYKYKYGIRNIETKKTQILCTLFFLFCFYSFLCIEFLTASIAHSIKASSIKDSFG